MNDSIEIKKTKEDMLFALLKGWMTIMKRKDIKERAKLNKLY